MASETIIMVVVEDDELGGIFTAADWLDYYSEFESYLKWYVVERQLSDVLRLDAEWEWSNEEWREHIVDEYERQKRERLTIHRVKGDIQQIEDARTEFWNWLSGDFE